MKISLAINSHNPRPDWLFECLDSAIGFDETILYCQCAPDSTYQAIEHYIDEHQDRNIVLVVDNVTRDIVDGFNLAIRSTTGDWVCSFCDDDTFMTDNLKELIGDIKKGRFDDADIVHYKVAVNGRAFWGSEHFNLSDLKISNQLPHGSFFRRRIFDELGGYEIECCTDWDFWLRAMSCDYRFRYFEKPVYDFRFGHASAFGRQRDKYPDMRKTVLENVQNYIHSRQVRG